MARHAPENTSYGHCRVVTMIVAGKSMSEYVSILCTGDEWYPDEVSELMDSDDGR